jgi:hypothetical protein
MRQRSASLLLSAAFLGLLMGCAPEPVKPTLPQGAGELQRGAVTVRVVSNKQTATDSYSNEPCVGCYITWNADILSPGKDKASRTRSESKFSDAAGEARFEYDIYPEETAVHWVSQVRLSTDDCPVRETRKESATYKKPNLLLSLIASCQDERLYRLRVRALKLGQGPSKPCVSCLVQWRGRLGEGSAQHFLNQSGSSNSQGEAVFMYKAKAYEKRVHEVNVMYKDCAGISQVSRTFEPERMHDEESLVIVEQPCQSEPSSPDAYQPPKGVMTPP